MIEQPSGRTGIDETTDLRDLIEDFFRTEFSTDNALITEAVRRMLSAGGKRLRPRLTLLAAEASGANPREHLALASYMELIHVATLIHDDVVDRADTRRGVNATAIDFGNRVSVLAGDYLFAWIFRNVTANYPHPVPNILSATLAEITDGEVLQLKALRNLDLPIASYVEIAMKKTASLFAASAECGAIMAGATPLRIKAMRDFGLYYGIAFQMLDDMLDFSENSDGLGKPVGNDVRERKMTLPVILALETGGSPVRAAFAAAYAREDDAGIESLVAAVLETGALERSADVIEGYVARAKQSLAPLGNAPARAKLTELADGLAERAAEAVRGRH